MLYKDSGSATNIRNWKLRSTPRNIPTRRSTTGQDSLSTSRTRTVGTRFSVTIGIAIWPRSAHRKAGSYHRTMTDKDSFTCSPSTTSTTSICCSFLVVCSRCWKYDGRGRLVQVVDVKGNVTHYVYNRADNLIHIEEPGSNVLST